MAKSLAICMVMYRIGYYCFQILSLTNIIIVFDSLIKISSKHSESGFLLDKCLELNFPNKLVDETQTFFTNDLLNREFFVNNELLNIEISLVLNFLTTEGFEIT